MANVWMNSSGPIKLSLSYTQRTAKEAVRNMITAIYQKKDKHKERRVINKGKDRDKEKQPSL